MQCPAAIPVAAKLQPTTLMHSATTFRSEIPSWNISIEKTVVKMGAVFSSTAETAMPALAMAMVYITL